MDLIIFGGQSNMQGQTDTLSEERVVEGALEYKYLTDELVPLKNPTGEDIRYDGTAGYTFLHDSDPAEWLKLHVTGSACYGYTNLVPAFCRAYVRSTGRSVVAAHIAKGSTMVADWLPGTPGYEALVKKGSAAKEKAGADRVFFVWLQGESDAIFRTSKEDYKSSLTALCEGLKRDLSLERFGVIRVGRFTLDERDIVILDAQDEICRENKDFLMLTELATALNERPDCMNPYCGGHFSALGLELLGEAAGNALGAYVNQAR